MILNMLTNGQFDEARDHKLSEISNKVNGRSSWDSPQYNANKEIQKSIKIDESRDALLTYAGLCQLYNRYFLKDKDGITVETPQSFFARVATGVCRGDVKFAQRLYDRLSQLHFMLATPVICNAGTNRGQQISCLTGDNKINTKDGFKNISNINVGDEVLTHTGSWKKVIGFKKQESSDIWALKTYKRSTEIKITGNHTVLTNNGWKRIDQININEDYIAINKHIQCDNSNLILDMMEYCTYGSLALVNDGKIYKKTSDKRLRSGPTNDNYLPIKERVEVNEDLAWIIGLWLAEGSLGKNFIRVTLHADESHLGDKFLNIINNMFGADGNQYLSEAKRNGKINKWRNAYANSSILERMFNNLFYDENKNKTIPSRFLDLPPNVKKSLIKGFFDGDGCIHADGRYNTTIINNENLCGQLYLMATSIGYDCSLRLDKPAGKLSKNEFNQTLSLFVDGFNEKSSQKIIDGDKVKYSRIRYLHRIDDYEDTVYDIQVEDDESFSVSGVVVHNCFLNRCEDSIEGIFDDMIAENAQISKGGGGIGTYMGDVRGKNARISIGGKSEGIIPFVKMIDSLVPAIKQAGMRKGAAAVYLNVDHPDIEDFIRVRDPTGGDENRRCMNLNNAVVVTDTFMKAVRDGEDYDLICPNTKKSVKKISARYIWEELIRIRSKTGEPYILFYDTINRNIPDHHQEMGLEVVQSNLCAEITLPTNYERTAVCCLGSVNFETFDQWENEIDGVTEDICRALDNVLENFIENAPDRYARAKYSARMERSIGVGAMGYHGYLMGKGWAFSSDVARCFNKNVFLKVKKGLIAASEKLAVERGPCPDGGNRRNSNLMAIAPTATISTIAGSATPCIEPVYANSYPIETMDGTFMMRNKYLTPILDKYGQNTPKIWRSISNKKGSVQHLDFLSNKEKEVFKIGDELDQREIIVQAAHRQHAMDHGKGGQSQSVNLFYKTPMDIQDLHESHMMAWKLGLKSLYYLRSTASSEADTADKIKQRSNKLTAVSDDAPKVCTLNPGTNPEECSVCQ